MRARPVIAALLSILVTLYAGVLLWFRLREDTIIFSPDVGRVAPPSAELGLRSRDVEFASGTERLTARVIPPPPSLPAGQAGWLLYFHGSSGNIGMDEYNEAWAEFRNQGLGVFAVDYRGFGQSSGTISEEGIYADALAAYRYLREQQGVPASRILIYGFSMGAAVAIELASRAAAAGMIVEGAWLSIPALGEERYPFLPVSLIAKNRFASIDKVAQIEMPKLFLHARGDQAIPHAHGEALFQRAVEPKSFRSLQGEHGTAHRSDPDFFPAVREFILARGLPVTELEPAGP